VSSAVTTAYKHHRYWDLQDPFLLTTKQSGTSSYAPMHLSCSSALANDNGIRIIALLIIPCWLSDTTHIIFIIFSFV
jgi:hypothetical protein